MITSSLEVFDTTLQTRSVWVNDIMAELDPTHRHLAYLGTEDRRLAR